MADDQDQAIPTPDQSDQGEAAPRSLAGDVGAIGSAIGGAAKSAYGAVSGGMQAAGQAVEGARQDIHGYLMGRNAVDQKTWDTMGSAVDPDGQMPAAERNHYIVTAAQQKDPMDLGPSAVEFARQRYSMLNAAAASALHQGNLQSAAQRATEAHNFVLDGSNTSFQPGNDGQIHITVQPFNGKPSQYVASPQQFEQMVHGPHAMWDNMVERSAGQVIGRIIGSGGMTQQNGPSAPSHEFAVDTVPPPNSGEAAGPPTPPELQQSAADTSKQPGLQKGDIEWVPNGNSGTGYWRARGAGGPPAVGGGDQNTPQGGSSQGTKQYPNPLTPEAHADQEPNLTINRFGQRQTINKPGENAAPPEGTRPDLRKLVETAFPGDARNQSLEYLRQRQQTEQIQGKLQAAENRGAAAALIRAQQLAQNTDNRVLAEHGRNATLVLNQLLKNNPQASLGDLLKTMHDNNIDPNVISAIHKAAASQQQTQQPMSQPAVATPAPHVEAPEIRYDAAGHPFIKGPDGKPVPYQPGQ